MWKSAAVVVLAAALLAGCAAMPEEEAVVRDVKKGQEIIAGADLLFDQGRFYKAFLEYENGLRYYPDIPRREEIVRREIEQIAYPYLDGKIKHGWFGTGLFATPRRRRGVEIIQQVVRSNVSRRYGFLADAQYKAATWLFDEGEFGLAQHEFEYLLENFKDSYWTTVSEYLLAESFFKQNMGPRYDQGTLDDAKYHYEEYLRRIEASGSTGDEERVKKAQEQLAKIHLLKAEKDYLIGRWYARMGDWRAARQQLRLVMAYYGDTDWAPKAEKLLKEVQAKIESNE
jgi:tetratricopeptide (TPR) repeat protein